MKLPKLTSTAVVLLVLSGCAQQQQLSENTSATGPTERPLERRHVSPTKKTVKSTASRADKKSKKSGSAANTAAQGDVWQVIKKELVFAHDVPDRKISEQLAWLDGNQAYFDNTLDRANLYLPYVVDKVVSAGLPAEVALLPFVESAYNPFAISPGGAAGLWQFIPSTGELFGLERNAWFEGRRDLVESTDAAIRYIQILNEQFKGDWLLTFAAYNSGPGTVQRAIAANQRKGLGTDFWSLNLPHQTVAYVPRLVALSKVITDPESYGIDRMHIPATPSFEVVELDTPIDLAQAARIMGVDAEDIQKLNPGYTRSVTPPTGPSRIVLPIDKKEDFLSQVSTLPQASLTPRQEYVVKQGDTLGAIARRKGSTVQELTVLNGLSANSVLRIGQVLRLPGAAPVAVAAPKPPAAIASSYTVKGGDSLWSIAHAHNISSRDLLAWNGLAPNSVIRPGQILKFETHTSAASEKDNISNYEVKRGDSLYNIARQFRVQVKDLLAWNDLNSRATIRPGQQLKIYRSN